MINNTIHQSNLELLRIVVITMVLISYYILATIMITKKVDRMIDMTIGTRYTNVKNFKCDDGQYVQGDGLHDDTTGIQTAMAHSSVLYFPHGAYKFSSKIYIKLLIYWRRCFEYYYFNSCCSDGE